MTSGVVGIQRHAVCFPLPVIIRYLQYHHTNRGKNGNSELRVVPYAICLLGSQLELCK